jgi:hypothetical protein
MPETDGDGDGDDGIEVEGLGERGGTLGDGDGQSGPSSIKITSFKDVEVDENDFEIGRSDILLSPHVSEEDGGISSHPNVEFRKVDLVNPNLKLKMKFSSIQLFREAVKQYNVRRGNDIRFEKNERAKCVAVCRDPSCGYRVYGRQMATDASFEIRSLRPKHSCTRVYKSSIVNSMWIADKLMISLRINQTCHCEWYKMKSKGNGMLKSPGVKFLEVGRRQKKKIYGGLGEQYGRLWDYCETLRRTNPGSCVMMKVQRPNPNSPTKFHRLYLSLTFMKKWFLEGCRPVIGLDGCFLKGPYKGILLVAIGRDANNNMYPIAIVIVESETKDNWTWFLECLVISLELFDSRPLYLHLLDLVCVVYITFCYVLVFSLIFRS